MCVMAYATDLTLITNADLLTFQCRNNISARSQPAITYANEHSSLQIKSLILLISSISWGADKSKINRFFLDYFLSANPGGLTLYFLNGGILKGPDKHLLKIHLLMSLSYANYYKHIQTLNL
jgi:hypothetical protein